MVHLVQLMLCVAVQVVQVYISWRDSPVPMPQLQLVSFKRLTIAPQQTVTVAMNVSSDELRVWHDDKGFILAPGHLSLSSCSAVS